jgi:hypothetical protein
MPPLELKFLTEDARLVELSRLYWELDQEGKRFPHQLKELAPRFSVSANNILDTVRESCVASSPAVTCEMCGNPRSYKSRSDYSEAQRHYRRHHSWQCWDCYREEDRRRRDDERRRRELAEQQALTLRRQRKELIEKAYTRQEGRDYLLPTELSLTSAIYLLSSMKTGGPVRTRRPHSFWEPLTESVEEPDVLSPRIIRNISPTKAFDEEILDRLKARGLVAVSAESEPEAFEFHDDSIVGYDSEKVLWQILPDVPAGERPSFVRQVEERLGRREYKNWHDECPRLWKKIAVEECIQFLVCTLNDCGYSYTPDAEASDLFGSLIDNYSLAQVFRQTDKATRDFADFARQQRWPMRAGRAVGQLQGNVEYYRSRGWEIFAFRYRPMSPARSPVSKIFFDTVLGIGEDYFFTAPQDAGLPEIHTEEKA